MDPLVRAVNLVDDHNHLVTQFQCAGEHKAGLRHGAFRRIHQKDNTVDHLQDTFHFAAEVRVARCIYYVNFGIAIDNGRILGHDRDSALPLQVSGVHNTVYNLLIFPVNTGLLQQFIHQSCLAVVNVGDDSNVSDCLFFHAFGLSKIGREITKFQKNSQPC